MNPLYAFSKASFDSPAEARFHALYNANADELVSVFGIAETVLAVAGKAFFVKRDEELFDCNNSTHSTASA